MKSVNLWNTLKEKTDLSLADTLGDRTADWKYLIRFVERLIGKPETWEEVNGILLYHSLFLWDTNPSSKYTLFIDAIVKTIEEEMEGAKKFNDEYRRMHELKYKLSV